MKNDHNDTKLCTSLFHYKFLKKCHKNKNENFTLQKITYVVLFYPFSAFSDLQQARLEINLSGRTSRLQIEINLSGRTSKL